MLYHYLTDLPFCYILFTVYFTIRSAISVPLRLFYFILQISGMEDLYVFKQGLVSIDTSGSLATTHSPAIISLKSLHIQEAGTFELISFTPNDLFAIDATNISVYKY